MQETKYVAIFFQTSAKQSRYVWERFISSKCDIVLQGWSGSKSNLDLARKKSGELEHFKYFDSSCTRSSRIPNEICLHTNKTQLACSDQRHLCSGVTSGIHNNHKVDTALRATKNGR